MPLVPSQTKNSMIYKGPSLRGGRGKYAYVPSETHTFEVIKTSGVLYCFLLSDCIAFYRFLGFQSEAKFPMNFNRNGFASEGLEQEMCIHLIKYWHVCLPRRGPRGPGGTASETLPVRLARDVCTFETRLGFSKRLFWVGKLLYYSSAYNCQFK